MPVSAASAGGAHVPLNGSAVRVFQRSCTHRISNSSTRRALWRPLRSGRYGRDEDHAESHGRMSDESFAELHGAEATEIFDDLRDLTDSAAVACYAQHANPVVRRMVAEHAYAGSAANGLSTDPDPSVRRGVALKHPQRHHSLAFDEHPWVREAVAMACTDPSVLADLAKDPEPIVRRYAALNEHCPRSVLSAAAEDNHSAVQLAAAAHPNTPHEAVAVLTRSPHASVRALVADHQAVFRDALMGLACDPDPEVRTAVAYALNAAPEALSGLAADTDPGVRKAAASRWIVFASSAGFAKQPSALAVGDLYERLAAANDAGTSEDTLSSLAGDEHPNVVKAAEREMQLRYPDFVAPPFDVCGRKVRGGDNLCEMRRGHRGGCWEHIHGPESPRGRGRSARRRRAQSDTDAIENKKQLLDAIADAEDVLHQAFEKDPLPGGPAPMRNEIVFLARRRTYEETVMGNREVFNAPPLPDAVSGSAADVSSSQPAVGLAEDLCGASLKSRRGRCGHPLPHQVGDTCPAGHRRLR